MNNKKVQLIVMNAMIGAAYAVLTILISPIAYGAVQMRLTEIIVLLACYNKKFIPGLTIGCLLANLASPMGLYDICFGTAATLIACLGMYYVKNVLSISDIQKIFAPLTEMFFGGKSDDISLEDIYKEIFAMEKELTNNLTKDVVRRFRSSQEIFSEVTDEAESDYLSRFAYICMLSFDVYIKKQLIERIIDETLEDPGKK